MTDDDSPRSADTPEPELNLAPADDRDRRDERAGQDPGDLIPALSARQIVGGFALLAALVMLFRRRGRGDSGPKA